MGLRFAVVALLLGLFTSTVSAQCPPRHFRVGPLQTGQSIGAGLPSRLVGTACINIETTENLATFDAVILLNLSHVQALADRIVVNLGPVKRKCGAADLKGFEVVISKASLENDFGGGTHFMVRGTTTPCALRVPVNFTLTMPVKFIVTSQKMLTLEIDEPTTDLPWLVNDYVSKKIYRQALIYTRKIHGDLTRFLPKEAFLFSPQLGDVTANFGNDVLTARVVVTGRITSAAATKLVNDKWLSDDGLHF